MPVAVVPVKLMFTVPFAWLYAVAPTAVWHLSQVRAFAMLPVVTCDWCAPTAFPLDVDAVGGALFVPLPWQLWQVTPVPRFGAPSMCSVVAAAPEPVKTIPPEPFTVVLWQFTQRVVDAATEA